LANSAFSCLQPVILYCFFISANYIYRNHWFWSDIANAKMPEQIHASKAPSLEHGPQPGLQIQYSPTCWCARSCACSGTFWAKCKLCAINF
jgi:hypothetical protein